MVPFAWVEIIVNSETMKRAVIDWEQHLLAQAEAKIYKEIDGADPLRIHFYVPEGSGEGSPRPLLLFLNGGAWDRAAVGQFAPQALYYASRGAVAGLVEVRNRASHPGSVPGDARCDLHDALRFVRGQAEVLRIDPAKVVAVGAGSGGHTAGAAALLPPVNESRLKTKFRIGAAPAAVTRPDGVIMISALVAFDRHEYGADRFASSAEARRASLRLHVTAGQPPWLILHGTLDRVAPCEDAEDLAMALQQRRNLCDFFPFEGRDHYFANLHVDPSSYEASLQLMDEFLARHKFLDLPEGDGARIITRSHADF